MIDALATERHYLAHLAPIWEALAPDLRGVFVVHPRVVQAATALGLDVVVGTRPSRQAKLVLVASYADERRVTTAPVVLVEHGAGQSYGDKNPSYSGGTDHRSVALFLCPNETVAARWRAAYPESRAAVIGAPKMDRWYSDAAQATGSAKQTPASAGVVSRPVVAVSSHWDCRIFPEARNAWPVFGPHLVKLTEHFQVIGHGHPRVFSRLRPAYERMGIEPVEDFEEVLERASVYVCDNSSTIFEWASLDQPVVLLNAPWYRRDVEHGLRFWRHAGIGPNVDDPEHLVDCVRLALHDLPRFARARRAMADEVYPLRDGCASVRAAAEIRNLVESPVLSATAHRRPAVSKSNPYAPKTTTARPRRKYAAPPEPEQSGPEAFMERLRSLGADDDQIARFTTAWEDWTDEDRAEALSFWAANSDDDMRAMIEGDRDSRARESMVGVPEPGEATWSHDSEMQPGTGGFALWVATMAGLEVGLDETTPQPVDPLPPEAGTTVDSILEWVGVDRGRAEQALASEQERERPRVTLTGRLEELLEAWDRG